MKFRVRLAVRRKPDGCDVLAGAGLPKFGSGDESPDEGDLVHRVSPVLALAGGGLLRAVGLVAGHFCTSCYVDRCHGEEQGDCRAEQVRPERSHALGLAADRQRSAAGEEVRLPYGVRRRST